MTILPSAHSSSDTGSRTSTTNPVGFIIRYVPSRGCVQCQMAGGPIVLMNGGEGDASSEYPPLSTIQDLGNPEDLRTNTRTTSLRKLTAQPDTRRRRRVAPVPYRIRNIETQKPEAALYG